MQSFKAKVIVKLKPTITDVKGQTLKRAIESIIDVKNLTCIVGNSYLLKFDANNQIEALKLVEKISEELLANEVTESYEIKSLETEEENWKQ